MKRHPKIGCLFNCAKICFFNVGFLIITVNKATSYEYIGIALESLGGNG